MVFIQHIEAVSCTQYLSWQCINCLLVYALYLWVLLIHFSCLRKLWYDYVHRSRHKFTWWTMLPASSRELIWTSMLVKWLTFQISVRLQVSRTINSYMIVYILCFWSHWCVPLKCWDIVNSDSYVAIGWCLSTVKAPCSDCWQALHVLNSMLHELLI